MYVSFSFLDVDDVKFVINYDFPGAVEDYIHRSYIARIFDNCRIIFLCSNRFNVLSQKRCFPSELVELVAKATLAPRTLSSLRRTAKTQSSWSTYSQRQNRSIIFAERINKKRKGRMWFYQCGFWSGNRQVVNPKLVEMQQMGSMMGYGGGGRRWPAALRSCWWHIMKMNTWSIASNPSYAHQVGWWRRESWKVVKTSLPPHSLILTDWVFKWWPIQPFQFPSEVVI